MHSFGLLPREIWIGKFALTEVWFEFFGRYALFPIPIYIYCVCHTDFQLSLPEKHKKILDELAIKQNFRPTEAPHKWYEVTRDDILSCKVLCGIGVAILLCCVVVSVSVVCMLCYANLRL